MRHARGQSARPSRSARLVLPAGQGGRPRRGYRVLADLAVPGLGLRRARPVRPGGERVVRGLGELRLTGLRLERADVGDVAAGRSNVVPIQA